MRPTEKSAPLAEPERVGQARIQLAAPALPERQCSGCVQCVPGSARRYIHSNTPCHSSDGKTHIEFHRARQNYGFGPDHLGEGNALQAYLAQRSLRPAIDPYKKQEPGHIDHGPPSQSFVIA